MHVHNDERRVYSISPYSVRMRENMDQKNSEYGRFTQWKNFTWKHEPQKPQNPKKILRKFPALNACAAIFQNADVSWSSLKVTKLSKF